MPRFQAWVDAGPGTFQALLSICESHQDAITAALTAHGIAGLEPRNTVLIEMAFNSRGRIFHPVAHAMELVMTNAGRVLREHPAYRNRVKRYACPLCVFQHETRNWVDEAARKVVEQSTDRATPN